VGIMKKYLGIIFLAIIFALSGCTDDSQLNGIDENEIEYPTSSEFWNETELDEFIFDAEFINIVAVDEFIEEYKINDMTFYSVDEYSNLTSTLDQLSALNIDRSDLPVSDDCEKENCKYVIIPLFSTWTFDDYTLDSSYVDGIITFTLTTNTSNFPQTMVKVLVLRIDSEFTYDIVINPQD
jgi:hypothetical protein